MMHMHGLKRSNNPHHHSRIVCVQTTCSKTQTIWVKQDHGIQYCIGDLLKTMLWIPYIIYIYIYISIIFIPLTVNINYQKHLYFT